MSEEERPLPIQPKTLTEAMMYATVRIEALYENGTKCSGTGFGYDFRDPKKDYRYSTIVTAAHHLRNAVGLRILFHTADNGYKVIGSHPIEIRDVQSEIIYHPDSDICVIDFQKLYDSELKNGIRLFLCPLDDSYSRTKIELCNHFSAVEDVLMFGYPLNLADEHNNYPIFRKGITASHPGVDFQGNPMGAVDIACFPGSSGSPVMIVHEGGPLVSKDGSTVLESQPGAILLGILTDGYVLTENQNIEIAHIPNLAAPASGQGKFVIHNLGLYTNAAKLADLYPIVSEKFVSEMIDYGPDIIIRKLQRKPTD